ncbi:MAG: di-heme oxidoredictase family protein, partial [Planctomycetota bacterium]
SPDALFAFGKVLFGAMFNTLDGAGRPATTGTGAARDPRSAPENFNRISAPDANSCSGCHNVPRQGGGGDNVANVFVLGQRFPFVEFDPNSEGDGFEAHSLEGVANERNTLGMFGAGFIELLAREMTVELQTLKAYALAQAVDHGVPVTVALVTKGVSFGELTANPAGTFDTGAVEGVNADLIVRPFHQKGVVVSLREFTNNAMNHHHGMQASERFGLGVDHDQDGKVDELTVGDVTAATLYQALLPVPGRKLPADPARRAVVDAGEALFASLGCAECHVPALRLESPLFSEPNPFNPAGNLQVADVPAPLVVDLTAAGPGPHLARETDGSVLVPAFTDLKRHDMGAELDNEQLVQGGVATELFLTRKLWGMANEPPYLHNGRALTIHDAIVKHGGEGLASREAYQALTQTEQRSVVDFLKTLQVLPENSPLEVVE